MVTILNVLSVDFAARENAVYNLCLAVVCLMFIYDSCSILWYLAFHEARKQDKLISVL